MQAIRNMEPAWVKVQGRNFALLHGIKGVAKRDAIGREQIVISGDRTLFTSPHDYLQFVKHLTNLGSNIG